MVQFVFTPWRNRAELLLVRQQLYPLFTTTSPHQTPKQNDPWWFTPTQLAALEHSLARVFLWAHRGACPHVVESTALLLSAIVLDARTSSDPSPGGGAVARAAVTSSYVVAFTRFVTGLLDSQQDRARKLSMYGVARTLGLPAAFVELRHQGTHEPMPGLGQLRPAARAALGWIWEYYWRHLGEAEGEEEEEEEGGKGGSGKGKGKEKGGTNENGAAGNGSGRPTATAAKEMDALKERMCRRTLTEYLQRRETVGAAREGLMRQLKRWELKLVMRTLVEVGVTTRDGGLLVRAVELARAILGEEEEVVKDGEEKDEAALRQELMQAVEKAENVGKSLGWGQVTGKRKMGHVEEPQEEDERDSKRGGWFKEKGPWVPRPIGTI